MMGSQIRATGRFIAISLAGMIAVSACRDFVEGGRHKLERLESNRDKACSQRMDIALPDPTDTAATWVDRFLKKGRFPGLSESATHDDSVNYALEQSREMDLDCRSAERELKLFMEGR